VTAFRHSTDKTPTPTLGPCQPCRNTGCVAIKFVRLQAEPTLKIRQDGATSQKAVLFNKSSKSRITTDDRSVSQSVSQSVSRSVSQSVGQSVSQSVSRSVSQSVSQSVGQSVSQSWCRARSGTYDQIIVTV
jgi:hypothetical protein